MQNFINSLIGLAFEFTFATCGQCSIKYLLELDGNITLLKLTNVCVCVGVVLLDLEEKELPGVAYRVVEQMAIDQLIKEEEKSTVIRALLLRHRHVNYHERFRFIRRNTASYTSLQVRSTFIFVF